VGTTVDAPRSFLTPPKVSPDSPITMAVVGDWGQTDNSVKTGQHMLDDNASITLIAGDLSYADGFQPYWDSWGRMAEGLLSSRPFMAAPGSIPQIFPAAHLCHTLLLRPRCRYSSCARQATTKSKRISCSNPADSSHFRPGFAFPQ
jgi:hypothetical protein